MRKHVSIVIAFALAAGCSSGHTGSTPKQEAPHAAPPVASEAATPTPTPARSGTVSNDQTSFLVRLTDVHDARSFTNGVQPERAKPGQKLIVVKIAVKNIGKRPSQLEEGNPQPLTLIDTAGASYNIEVTWSSSDNINPGLTKVEPYTFPVPAAAKPASVHVELTDANGNPSAVDLKVP